MPIWWHLPWPFHLVSAVYDVTAWFVAGLVLAAFIRPPLRPSAAAALAAWVWPTVRQNTVGLWQKCVSACVPTGETLIHGNLRCDPD